MDGYRDRPFKELVGDGVIYVVDYDGILKNVVHHAIGKITDTIIYSDGESYLKVAQITGKTIVIPYDSITQVMTKDEWLKEESR